MERARAEDAASMGHARLLDALARADADRLGVLAEALLPALGPVEVVHSRTGLVMLPMRDTVRGTDFHLGEVLVAEAHLRAEGVAGGVEGYGMVVGRGLERAMAMAVVDAAAMAGLEVQAIAAFVEREAAATERADDARLRAVEATRVEMETF